MRTLAHYPFLTGYIAFVEIWLVGCLLAWGTARLRKLTPPSLNTCVPVLGFAFLGLTIGVMAGNSREPAVSVTITGLLGLYGGLAIYLFGTNQSIANQAALSPGSAPGADPTQPSLAEPAQSMAKQRLAAGLALVVVSFGLAYGIDAGSNYRGQNDAAQRDVDRWYRRDSASFQTDLEIYKAAMTSRNASLQPNVVGGTLPPIHK